MPQSLHSPVYDLINHSLDSGQARKRRHNAPRSLALSFVTRLRFMRRFSCHQNEAAASTPVISPNLMTLYRYVKFDLILRLVALVRGATSVGRSVGRHGIDVDGHRPREYRQQGLLLPPAPHFNTVLTIKRHPQLKGECKC